MLASLELQEHFKWKITLVYYIIFVFSRTFMLENYIIRKDKITSVHYAGKTWVIWKSIMISFLVYIWNDFKENLDKDDLFHSKERNSTVVFQCVWIYTNMKKCLWAALKVVEIGVWLGTGKRESPDLNSEGFAKWLLPKNENNSTKSKDEKNTEAFLANCNGEGGLYQL